MDFRPIVFDLSTYRLPKYMSDDSYGGITTVLDDTLYGQLYNLPKRSYPSGRAYGTYDIGRSTNSFIFPDKNEFYVNLDVQNYKPSELSIKIEDGYLVVEGKSKERADAQGLVSRQFTRRYKIPENVDDEAMKSNLSLDKWLTIRAPKKNTEPEVKEIPIVRVPKPAPIIEAEPEEAAEEGAKE